MKKSFLTRATREFKDQLVNHPKLIRPILDGYKRIFLNDAQTVHLSPADRLTHHRRYCEPVFDSIVTTCQRVFAEKLILPNTELAKPFQYVLNHEKVLRGFLDHEGAPVSNNLAERTILYLVMLRKNSHFFKTTTGARVADTILSIGLSAFYLGVNLFHYFRLGLAHQDELRRDPEAWLPWNFLERYPEYELHYKSRRGSWPMNPDQPLIPLTPPR